MSLSPSYKERILRAFDGSRTRLPPVVDVAARPNVRRLASISRKNSGKAVLNLSTAVVEAGEAAWALVAPALEGDRASRLRIRELARDGIEANRARRRADGAGGRTRAAVRRAPTLPPTSCDGAPEQRRYLLDLIAFVRETSGYEVAMPCDIQVRISCRMSSALGSCTSAGTVHRITISERLFRPGLEDVLWDTVKHELAHLADRVTLYEEAGDGARKHRPHGARWRAWARRLGAVPERRCDAHDTKRIVAAQHRGCSGPLRYPAELSGWPRLLSRTRGP